MQAIVRCIVIFSTLLFLAGCAFTSQQATINPDIQITEENIGKGRAIFISVNDERPDKVLGRRGTGAMSGAAITTDQDIADVFFREISDGLVKQGFSVVADSGSSEISIDIELRELKYSTSMGFWTGGVHMNAAMKAEATADGGSYTEFYRVDKEKRVVFVNFANENEAIINAAASELIQQFFDDRALIGFLTE